MTVTVFSADIADCLVRCRTAPELRPPNTDHYPIITELEVDVPRVRPRTFRNFRKVDWPRFRTTLAEHLEEIPLPEGHCTIPSIQVFDATLARLMEALRSTIDKEVPETRPPPYAKRWFSKELDDMRREVGRAARLAHKLLHDPDHAVHKDYRRLRNRYGDRI